MTADEAAALRDAMQGNWKKANALELEAALRADLKPIGPDGPLEDMRLIDQVLQGPRLVGYRFAKVCPECGGNGTVTYQGLMRGYEIECPACEGEETDDSETIVTDLLGAIIQTVGD